MAITVYAIAKRVGRNSSLLYKIKNKQRLCSPKMAMELDALGIDGWGFKDLRPDLVEAALKSVNQEADTHE
jgi:hypothetical protein